MKKSKGRIVITFVLVATMLILGISGCATSPYSKVISDGHNNHSSEDHDDSVRKKKTHGSYQKRHNHSH